MNLSEHFTKEELIASQLAVRKGIKNEPTDAETNNLKKLAETLELVRDVLGGKSILINSGFRSFTLNSAIGGVSTSAHLYGYAADFICPSFGTPRQVVDEIVKAGIKFDQLICEGTWVHISVDPKMRQEVLNATFKNGKAQYSKG
jgi:uncharacterized protein YcbK (DUF882 family)